MRQQINLMLYIFGNTDLKKNWKCNFPIYIRVKSLTVLLKISENMPVDHKPEEEIIRYLKEAINKCQTHIPLLPFYGLRDHCRDCPYRPPISSPESFREKLYREGILGWTTFGRVRIDLGKNERRIEGFNAAIDNSSKDRLTLSGLMTGDLSINFPPVNQYMDMERLLGQDILVYSTVNR